MKSLVVVTPSVPDASQLGSASSAPERRRHQRRMGLARRIEVGSISGERRSTGSRRRRPDRRIGLSPNLDLYLLGI